MIAVLLGLLAQLLHTALVLAAAPLVVGLMRIARARRLGQAGPPLLQPWHDLIRLARKQPVVAEGAGPLLVAAPLVEFAASLAAAVLVPGFALGMTTAPLADLLVLGGLLALARAAPVLAAMEAGTAPGGLAAGRAVAVATLAAPALLLVAFALALATGSSNIDRIATLTARGTTAPHAALALALAALVLLAPPADDAALRGAYSGRHLALAEGAAALRTLTLLSLIVAVFVPYGAADAAGLPLLWPPAAVVWAAKLGLLATGLASVQAAQAMPTLAGLAERRAVALALAWLAALLLCVEQGFA